MGRKKIQRYIFDDYTDVQMRVERILKILDCDTAICALPTILKTAQDLKLSHLEFIELLFEQEMQKREDERIERWRKQAKFPWIKNLETYDFDFPEFIERDKVLQLAGCRWIENGANVIFFGPSGVGKTHLSIALGLEAINKGFETRFVTVDRLTEMIAMAVGRDKATESSEHRKKLLSIFSNVKLLILDELAYSTVEPEVSEFVRQLIFRRYDLQTSTIITSNEGVETWAKIFGDNEVRTMAMLDRILHDCVPIKIHGESFRSAGMRTSGGRVSNSKNKLKVKN